MGEHVSGRLRRLAEELEESGSRLEGTEDFRKLLLQEVDVALRPSVHERRVPSSGTFLEPKADPATWSSGTELEITRGSVGDLPLSDARRFADGISSWVLRRTDGTNEWMVFDRPAGSERDLVVMADGSPRRIPLSVKPEVLAAAFTWRGGDKVELPGK